MKYHIIAILLGVLSFKTHSRSEIAVSYIEPMKYNDIESTDQSRARSIKDFEKSMNEYFEQVAAKYLKENHRLQLEIVDVDRAGTFRYDLFPAHRGLRVLKDTAVVRIRVNYTLFDDRKTVIRSGEENIREFFNMNSGRFRQSSREQLYFEKELLSKWLSKLYN